MIKAIIFDMDGVMFDTERLYLECAMESAKSMNLNVNEEVIKKSMGGNYKRIEKVFLEELGDDFPFFKFYSDYEKRMNSKIENEGIITKEGLYEVLNYFKDKKYKMAIASSNKRNRIYNYLKMTNIDSSIFDAIISGEDIEKGKPSPDIYNITCRKLNIDSSEAFVLEDSNNGVIAAYLAGCKIGLIPDVVPIKKETIDMANYKFANLKQFLNYFEQIK